MEKNCTKRQDLNIEWLVNEYPILEQIKKDIIKNKKLFHIFSSFGNYINILEKKIEIQKLYFDKIYGSLPVEKKNFLHTDVEDKKYDDMLIKKAKTIKKRIYDLEPKY